ncbi:tRNA (adenosine(37)-N6)-threonylcarbamoyltransferase complex dimerization subunit type 1 TsaB [Corynebacterium sp.]|uniref:tRNA (adenosine(37)-N6)-threonylcarbamoyltransferase complex dimerization subunit type 1 TsaB n=1 Tax=Corynebacterium sp. TaxID=1720 RepID=UPI0026DC6DD6|nr:tRNA (adenosine(37)-N6)-threonylcarbamoyltransferase complex dimerization subunit type 1 TsaB [Corynebacterium sp.]MDO4610442.1 tRNA (adenosine(37)-N6)-threonylcarbamoyltransferase complex dimerization subunit type 1 TsaB [Corynebacterium sp.]
MLVLVVDTSTPQVTAGIVDVPGGGGAPRTLAMRGHVDARAHNEALVPLILECLGEAGVARRDLGAVVAGDGPGPFTGLRVGMATAAAFGDALGIPVHGVCSLDSLVQTPAADLSAVSGDPAAAADAPVVLAVTDARRREVYAAAYRADARVWGPAVLAPGAVLTELDDAGLPAPSLIVGDADLGARVAGESGADVVARRPDPALLAARADLGAAPEPLVARYLRRPDAMPPKPRPRSAALPDPAGVPGVGP